MAKVDAPEKEEEIERATHEGLEVLASIISKEIRGEDNGSD